jgi:hypothetical protein
MVSISTFYLHHAASTESGTLPSPGGAVTFTATWVASGLGNKILDDVPGTIQQTMQAGTVATTTYQAGLMGRWLSAPLAAQTIPAQTVVLRIAAKESSSSANAQIDFYLGLWRPSTGQYFAISGAGSPSAEIGTGETNYALTKSFGAITAQDGDLLLLEVQSAAIQAMATSYTVNIYYDGTTIDSTTSNRALMTFPTALTMYSPPSGPSPTDYWGAAA